jgi:hypothetical protein
VDGGGRSTPDVLADRVALAAGEAGHAVAARALAGADRYVLVEVAQEHVAVRRDEDHDTGATGGPVAVIGLDLVHRCGVAQLAHGG